MDMLKNVTLLVAALTLVVPGCDKSDTKDAASDDEKANAEPAAGEKPAADEPAADEPAADEPAADEPAADSGEVELEVVEVPELGNLKLPKGRKETAPKNWSYDLGGSDRLTVSWEPHGAKNLKAAEKLANVLGNAPTSKKSETLENGTHFIERVRDNDGWTFVVVFGDSWYVKCSAPQDKMDICHEIVTSKE
jgi:hypothetical protein